LRSVYAEAVYIEFADIKFHAVDYVVL